MNAAGSILLTGATGFLGSHLLKGLLEQTDASVIVLKRSFSNTFRIDSLLAHPRVRAYDANCVSLESVFQENSIDTILHCATNYGRNNEDLLNIVESNLILPLTLLQLAIKYQVQRFINTDTVIDKKVNHYSLSKHQFLEWLKASSHQLQCINVSLEHFYGALDNTTKFTTFIIRSLLKKETALPLTQGEQKRYFIYIDDVVEAFLIILKSSHSLSPSFSSFEVSTEESISIKEFVCLVKALTQNTVTDLQFGAIPYRTNELMECKTDITALKHLGWMPRFSLTEGLELTIEKENATR